MQFFGEMSPIFCTTDVPYDLMGDHMQNFVEKANLSKKPRRLLVGGMAAEKILLATPLLKWYMEKGLVVTNVYQAIEYVPERCFKSFQEKVCTARRSGDDDISKAIIADTFKLIGNSGYGSLIMDKEKHRNITYVGGRSKAVQQVNKPHFIAMTELSDDMYEVESGKKSIKLDLPIVLGYFILQYAKLRMLEFYYDCLLKYIDKSDFQLCEMDTDSFYFAISAKCLRDVVKPSLQSEFDLKINGSCHRTDVEGNQEFWFPRECCNKHIAFDKRTSGLFKQEAIGTEMICLSSKTYVLKESDTNCKYSCKGINKSCVTSPLQTYKSVLDSKEPVSAQNVGFRARNNTIWTYQQERQGFGYFYCKREVLDDGVTTVPLQLLLNPWPQNDVYYFEESDPLGHTYKCFLTSKDKEFTSAAQLFSYEKALFHKMDVLAESILESKSPIAAAKMGNEIENSAEWYRVRDGIMLDILRIKSNQDHCIKDILEREHSQNFVSLNKYNTYWDCGHDKQVAEVTEPKKFPGQNRLGELWKEIAKEMVVDELENTPAEPDISLYTCKDCSREQRDLTFDFNPFTNLCYLCEVRRKVSVVDDCEEVEFSFEDCGCVTCDIYVNKCDPELQCPKCNEELDLDEYFTDKEHFCLICAVRRDD